MTAAPLGELTGQRQVHVRLTAEVLRPTDVVLSLAVAAGYPLGGERIDVAVGGRPMRLREMQGPAGVRRHIVHGAPPGILEVSYAASVQGARGPELVTAADELDYLWPSRYVDSDRLGHVALQEFGELTGWALVDAVSAWVAGRLAYVPGSSDGLDSASDTYLRHAGVCRDFAHLTMAVLRARGLPARMVSVYAVGLVPMDFHAVVEVAIDGRWWVVDATGLAPRGSLIRIATGPDAASTAFLTVARGDVRFGALSVEAWTRSPLPQEDPRDRCQLR